MTEQFDAADSVYLFAKTVVETSDVDADEAYERYVGWCKYYGYPVADKYLFWDIFLFGD